jgi:predicted alpha/beta hydrolase family esterase
MGVIEQYKEFLTPETIVIGHSLGSPFVLDVLEHYPARLAVLVCAFIGKAGNDFDDSMKTFAQKEFDWHAIKQHCQHFMIFHADNDPYILLEKAQAVAEHLGVDVTLVPGAGHFNTAAGYTAFPLLLEDLRQFL